MDSEFNLHVNHSMIYILSILFKNKDFFHSSKIVTI